MAPKKVKSPTDVELAQIVKRVRAASKVAPIVLAMAAGIERLLTEKGRRLDPDKAHRRAYMRDLMRRRRQAAREAQKRTGGRPGAAALDQNDGQSEQKQADGRQTQPIGHYQF